MSETPLSCARFHSEKVERRATSFDVALDPPGDRRDVRVPGPLRLVAVAVEARLDREGPRLGRVPGGLLEHRRIRVIAPVGNRLDEHEEADETADHV